MTLAELMSGLTPSAAYNGMARADDMVLAVDIAQSDATPFSSFEVVGGTITGVAPALNPQTQDRNYLRVGQQTTKTSEQRTFKVTGDLKCGDAFLDWALSHAVKFGHAASVVARYIWFNMLTGKGETGKVAVIINSDGAGEAGNNATIDIDLKATGGVASAYTYEAASLAALTVASVAGTASGDTRITVTGQGAGQLVYKTSTPAVLAPAYGDEATGYILFDPPVDVKATTGHKINVAEITAQGKIIAFGTATVASKA